MGRYLVHAIVGYEGHGDAQFGGNVDGDVVHAHAESPDDFQILGLAHDPLGDQCEAREDAVYVPRQCCQRILAAVGRYHYLRVGAREYSPLRLDGRPDVIRD